MNQPCEQYGGLCPLEGCWKQTNPGLAPCRAQCFQGKDWVLQREVLSFHSHVSGKVWWSQKPSLGVLALAGVGLPKPLVNGIPGPLSRFALLCCFVLVFQDCLA